MKLEDILKAKGLTDADIAAMQPLLTNQAYRTALENSYTELSSERDALKVRDAEWQNLHDTQWQPLTSKLEKDASEARRRAAELEETVKIAKDYGYLPEDAQRKADEAAAASRAAAQSRDAQGRFNAQDPDFMKFAGDFARREGDAIALFNYLGEEHRQLTGKSINEYVNPTTGRRGMVALREEALAANKPIDQYMESKFNWQGLRAEQEAKRKQEYEESIRRDERQKVAMENSGNPMLGRPQASRDPLIPARKQGDKMPWEIPAGDRRASRLEKYYQTEAKERVH